MKYTLSYTEPAFKDIKNLKKKYHSIKQDLEKLEDLLLENPFQGDSLGHSCYKVRMAISSKSAGKSGGANAELEFALSKVDE